MFFVLDWSLPDSVIIVVALDSVALSEQTANLKQNEPAFQTNTQVSILTSTVVLLGIGFVPKAPRPNYRTLRLTEQTPLVELAGKFVLLVHGLREQQSLDLQQMVVALGATLGSPEQADWDIANSAA